MTNENNPINLRARLKLVRSERDVQRKQKEQYAEWLNDRNQEVNELMDEITDLKKHIATLQRNLTLVCGQRDTAQELADSYYKALGQH